MAIQELSAIKLPRRPALEELLPYAKRLQNALFHLKTWQSISSKDINKSTMSDIKLLTDLFGYVPYTGRCYRGFQWLKGKPFPEEGAVLKLNVSKRTVSSWSASPKVALAFTRKRSPMAGDGPRAFMAIKKHNDKYQGGVVVELQDKGLQLMNMRYMEAVLQYLFAITRGKPVQHLSDQRRALMKEGRDKEAWKVLEQIHAFIGLRTYIEAFAKSIKGWIVEDEVIMQLKDSVRVRVVKTVEWD